MSAPSLQVCFLSVSTSSGVRPPPSSDPAAPETGDGLHTAALLHDHVDVGFHDLGDLTNLEAHRQTRQSKSGPISFLKIGQAGHFVTYLGRFEEHLPLVHGDLVGARLRSSKEDDVFVREGFQGFGLASLVHRHVFSAHTQPQIMREASFFTL